MPSEQNILKGYISVSKKTSKTLKTFGSWNIDFHSDSKLQSFKM